MSSITLSESVSLANSVATDNTPYLDSLSWLTALRNTFLIIFNTEKERSELATLAAIVENILRGYHCNRILLTTGSVINNFVGTRTNELLYVTSININK